MDDIISIASSTSTNDHFKEELKARWDISDLGPIKFVLGITITRSQETGTISISQTALIDRIVEQFNQQDAHAVDIPMVAGLQLR